MRSAPYWTRRSPAGPPGHRPAKRHRPAAQPSPRPARRGAQPLRPPAPNLPVRAHRPRRRRPVLHRPCGCRTCSRPSRPAVPHRGPVEVKSVLPFLVTGPLARLGVLDALLPALAAAGIRDGADLVARSQLFAAALGCTVLGPLRRGWLRDPADRAAAAAFAGLDDLPDEAIGDLVRTGAAAGPGAGRRGRAGALPRALAGPAAAARRGVAGRRAAGCCWPTRRGCSRSAGPATRISCCGTGRRAAGRWCCSARPPGRSRCSARSAGSSYARWPPPGSGSPPACRPPAASAGTGCRAGGAGSRPAPTRPQAW